MTIKTVGVIGAGVMGQGIAQACAIAGYSVVLFDVNQQQCANAIDRIRTNLEALVVKGKLRPEDQKAILSRIVQATRTSEIVADLVIEAIIENLQLKKELFADLEKGNRDCILATNTSTFPISDIAAELQRPGQCIGLHFFNPATVMKLVEVIVGKQTLPEVRETIFEFARSLRKQPVLVNDKPGFVVNRVARGYYLESLNLLEEAEVSKESIDALMRSAGFRMGPFELMDLIGIDTNLAVTSSLYEAFNRPERFKPSRIQEALVKEGRLGVKTSKGFYDYPR